MIFYEVLLKFFFEFLNSHESTKKEGKKKFSYFLRPNLAILNQSTCHVFIGILFSLKYFKKKKNREMLYRQYFDNNFIANFWSQEDTSG